MFCRTASAVLLASVPSHLIAAFQHSEEMTDTEPGSSQWWLLGGQKAKGVNWNKRGSSQVWDGAFHYEDGQEAQQVAHRGCAHLEVFKTRLNEVISSLVWSQSWIWFGLEAGLETCKGPFHPEPPYDSSLFPIPCSYSFCPLCLSFWNSCSYRRDCFLQLPVFCGVVIRACWEYMKGVRHIAPAAQNFRLHLISF